MSAVSVVRREKETQADGIFALLGRTRQFDIPELIIRFEQALKAYGNPDLFEPGLERLREMDENLAKVEDLEMQLKGHLTKLRTE